MGSLGGTVAGRGCAKLEWREGEERRESSRLWQILEQERRETPVRRILNTLRRSLSCRRNNETLEDKKSKKLWNKVKNAFKKNKEGDISEKLCNDESVADDSAYYSGPNTNENSKDELDETPEEDGKETYKTSSFHQEYFLRNKGSRLQKFSPHLPVESVRTVEKKNSGKHDLTDIGILTHNGRKSLIEHFPGAAATVNIIFTMGLQKIQNNNYICRLFLDLHTIIFSVKLLSINCLDTILFVIMKFLHDVSHLIKTVENCHHFSKRWCKLLSIPDKMGIEDLLAEIRSTYVDMWCNLVLS